MARTGTTVVEIYQTLRSQIIRGDLKPGLHLSQRDLAENLQVSRTPLREALQRLEVEGLVVGQANRGMYVAPVSLIQVEASYALRLLVEPTLVGAIVSSITAADVQRMEDALSIMRAPLQTTSSFQEAHFSFHQVLLARYPSGFAELISQQLDVIARHQRAYFSRPLAYQEFTEVDALFLQAVIARNGPLARRLMEFHLLDAAIGLLWGVDREHSLDVLMVVSTALGINCFRTSSDSQLRMSWQERLEEEMPRLETSNVVYAR